jgi:hypothetical protein
VPPVFVTGVLDGGDGASLVLHYDARPSGLEDALDLLFREPSHAQTPSAKAPKRKVGRPRFF